MTQAGVILIEREYQTRVGLTGVAMGDWGHVSRL